MRSKVHDRLLISVLANVVGLEVLNASERVENPRGVEYAVTG